MTVQHFSAVLRELPTTDLNLEKVRRIARELYQRVGDTNTHPSIWEKAARIIADGKIEPQRIDEILASLEKGKRAGRIQKPGAYFSECLRRDCARLELPW
jgi:hypothetical protein